MKERPELFAKLIPHLTPDQFAIVGGLATRYHLARAGIAVPSRPFNDLDIAAFKKDTVKPSVTQDFLVYHHHPKDNYFALVDPQSRSKVDVFLMTDKASYSKIPFGKNDLLIISAEDQIVKTAYDVLDIVRKANIDPKWLEDIALLSQIVDHDKANQIWQQRNYSDMPSSWQEALSEIEKIKTDQSEKIVEKPFRRPRPYKCDQCVTSEEFPIAPMGKIYQIMGYNE